jgi:hypothetical protein
MTDESVCQGLHKVTRELRDRWLSGPLETKRGSRSVKERDILENGETGLCSVVSAISATKETDYREKLPYASQQTMIAGQLH